MSHGARTDERVDPRQRVERSCLEAALCTRKSGGDSNADALQVLGVEGTEGGEVEGVKERNTHTLTCIRVHAKQGDLAFQQW
jgi:hypothetical protein